LILCCSHYPFTRRFYLCTYKINEKVHTKTSFGINRELNPCWSAKFMIHYGVRQGSVLSPFIMVALCGHHRANLSGYMLATKAHIDNRKKYLLSSNISSRCSRNMANLGPPAAEIDPVVWGTPANFNGFRVLAALLHGSLVVGVSQTAALNRRRHLYSAGRPSRWTLAHILVFIRLHLQMLIMLLFVNVINL